MKKTILLVSVAVIIGLVGGYFLFNSNSNMNGSSEESHVHDKDENGYWTCSMHPQVMQPEPGSCPICGMDLIPAETDGGSIGINEIKMTENAMALANIETLMVGKMMNNGDSDLVLSGKIEINEEANAIQASYFDGRIERLNIDYKGQEVRKGQLLATIYSPNLVAAQQELITAASLKESQPTLYKAVRNKLNLWKLSEEQINAIETSGTVRENFPIYATVSGTVAEKLAAEGDYVKQGQPILKVSNLSTVWADFDAYESQIAQFKIGQQIKIISSAYPNKDIQAKITFIDPVLNTRTRTVTVRATLDNREGLLKPGMFVKGSVAGNRMEHKSGQFTIPASAVMWTGERSLVYIKTKPDEPVFEMREITLGDRIGDSYNVVSGLQEGDEIVVNGTFTVDAAAQLQGKRSMMNDKSGEPIPTHDHGAMLQTSGQTNSENAMFSATEVAPLLAAYMDLKTAFVSSEVKMISDYANVALVKLNNIVAKKDLTGDRNVLQDIGRPLSSMKNASDIKEQRKHFSALSDHMVSLAGNIEHLEEKLYVQFCPMANQDKGGYWLSWDSEIRNPYYGEAMLSCGEVQKIL